MRVALLRLAGRGWHLVCGALHHLAARRLVDAHRARRGLAHLRGPRPGARRRTSRPAPVRRLHRLARRQDRARAEASSGAGSSRRLRRAHAARRASTLGHARFRRASVDDAPARSASGTMRPSRSRPSRGRHQAHGEHAGAGRVGARASRATAARRTCSSASPSRAARRPCPASSGMVGLFINTLAVRVRRPRPTRRRRPGSPPSRTSRRSSASSSTPRSSTCTGWQRDAPRHAALREPGGLRELARGRVAARRAAAASRSRSARAATAPPYPLTVVALAPRDAPAPAHRLRRARRFDDGAVERMLGHLTTLLEGLAATPGRAAPASCRSSPTPSATSTSSRGTTRRFLPPAGPARAPRVSRRRRRGRRTPSPSTFEGERLTLPRARRARQPPRPPPARRCGVGPDVLVGARPSSARSTWWSASSASSRRAAPTCRSTRTTRASASPSCSRTPRARVVASTATRTSSRARPRPRRRADPP